MNIIQNGQILWKVLGNPLGELLQKGLCKRI
ncbi:hypothetical protein PVE_R1G5856 [Pseudomonas veronii 1YdBTEX2]|uniref:Uncharacterized protein n=1 Tax=Pseudomonas veronii 1YdBTEX2 TaxID=1295141 RepID=A0A1D3K668_PSEVE|nr:hypothetical protein PVE_R1G5856 [Pseudomonas veronii 1YdBTEX2]